MEAPKTPAELRAKALRYRHMAVRIMDQRTVAALLTLADEYDDMAARLEDDVLGHSRPR